MADLIDRHAALREFIEGDGDDEFTTGYNFAVDEYRREIAKIPAVNRWISCKEKLPEKDKSYITYSETTKYGTHNEIPEELRINVLYFDGEDWYDEACTYYNVTHYMPLPEPPESEVQNG